MMTGRAVSRTAAMTAERLTRMVAPALLPAERKMYYRKVFALVRKLIRACERRAKRDFLKDIKPSMN